MPKTIKYEIRDGVIESISVHANSKFGLVEDMGSIFLVAQPDFNSPLVNVKVYTVPVEEPLILRDDAWVIGKIVGRCVVMNKNLSQSRDKQTRTSNQSRKNKMKDIIENRDTDGH